MEAAVLLNNVILHSTDSYGMMFTFVWLSNSCSHSEWIYLHIHCVLLRVVMKH